MSVIDIKKVTLPLVKSESTPINVYPYSVTLENFDRVCRFCVGYHDSIEPIFKVWYKNISLQNIIADCTSLKVDVGDFLPQNICPACLAEAIRCYNFREKCLQMESILIDVYNKLNAGETIANVKKENKVSGDEGVKQIEFVAVNDSENFSDPSAHKQLKDKLVTNLGEQCITEGSQGPLFKRSPYSESFNTSICTTICKKRFTKCKLKRHIQVHTKEKPFICKICYQGFRANINLKRHMMTHTGERPHTCEVCGKGFIQTTGLRIHKETHNVLKSSKCFTCEICGRVFKRQGCYHTHLSKHKSKADVQEKDVKPACKSENTGGYICDICKRVYKTKDALRSHVLTHGERCFLCSECGKSFLTQMGLNSHLIIHTGKMPYTCTVCEKSFARVGSFESHMLIHTGKKPYNCKVCGQPFRLWTHLKNHSRTHSGEKPYTCSYCNKKFALKGALTVHVRIHTGEKPYLCPICGKEFAISSNRKTHCRRKHGITSASDISNAEQKCTDSETKLEKDKQN